jgi:ribonuclease-3
MKTPDTRVLEDRIGYRFQQPSLLLEALTHRSLLADEPEPAARMHNERLEFLGDAVLALRASERLWDQYPLAREGELTRRRSWLVSSRHLAEVGRRLDLGAWLRLARSEERLGGREKARLLGNAVEALLGAIYRDGGYAAAARFADEHILAAGVQSEAVLPDFAYKSLLQEWSQRQIGRPPTYTVVEATGPDHERVFTVEVEMPGVYRGRASGPSKKAAQQKAAFDALRQINALPFEAEPPGEESDGSESGEGSAGRQPPG